MKSSDMKCATHSKENDATRRMLKVTHQLDL